MTTLSVPTQELDWRILSNVALGGTGTYQGDHLDFLLKFLRALTNHSDYSGSWLDTHGEACSAPTACSVVYSSDGAANYGAADYITSAASKIVFNAGGSNHSYAVLSFPGIGEDAELCIDFANDYGNYPHYFASFQEAGQEPTSNQYGGFYFSHTGGFSSNGGTLSRRPWAANEVQIFHRSSMKGHVPWLHAIASPWTGKMHIMRTADGSLTRAVVCIGGVPLWSMFLEVPGNPFHTNTSPDHIWNGADVPWFGSVYNVDSQSAIDAMTYGGDALWLSLYNSSNVAQPHLMSHLAAKASPTNNAIQVIYPSTIAVHTGYYGENLCTLNDVTANKGDGGYALLPLWLSCVATDYAQPILGKWQDIYLVGSGLTNGSSGAEDSLSSGYSWRKFGNFLLPWDRSACEMS